MRKHLPLLIVTFFTCMAASSAQDAFINEFDYDQPGDDIAEFVEVALDLNSCGGPCVPSDFTVVLYNGNTGSAAVTYGSATPLPSAPTGADGPYSLFLVNYPQDGLQNGPRDAIALVYQTSTVLQFISYEGVATASNGPAAGQTSTDVGVNESNTAPNLSIARQPDGTYALETPSPGTANDNPLPVALAAFDVTPAGSGVAALAWATATERDNAFFAVEVARDGEADFREVGRVTGAGTSAAWRDYAYTYRAAAPGRHYFRLRQVDFDGAYAYSPVVTANLSAAGKRFAVRHDLTGAAYRLETEAGGTFRLLDAGGAVRATFTVEPGARALDLGGVPAGLYVVTDGVAAVRVLVR